MEGYYTVSEYSKVTGKDAGNIRKKLIKGELKGEKIGSQWVIPQSTIYPKDKRIKSGEYRNWRKGIEFRRNNYILINVLKNMCREINSIYGPMLEKIVLYGSYARGEETVESDVDIALILNKGDTEEQHEAMIEVVVEYELKQGVTLSVISIDKNDMLDWNNVLPFYRNIEKDGIILWKKQ